MGRSKTGEAIPLGRRTPEALAALTAMLGRARADGRLDVWLRVRAVLGYIDGVRVVELARQLDVGRTSINNWLLWYARTGADGLTTAKPGRSEPKLSAPQREQTRRSRRPPGASRKIAPASRGTSDDIGLRLWLTEGTATGR